MTELIHSGDLRTDPEIMQLRFTDCPHTGTVYSGGFRLRSDRNPYLSAPVKKKTPSAFMTGSFLYKNNKGISTGISHPGLTPMPGDIIWSPLINILSIRISGS